MKNKHFKKKKSAFSLKTKDSQEETVFPDSDRPVHVTISTNNFHAQLQVINLKQEDLEYIQRYRSFFQEQMDTVLERFFENVSKEPQLVSIVSNHSSVSKLGNYVKQHLLQLFDFQLDQQFIERCKKIGKRHVEVSLPSFWYIAAIEVLANAFMSVLEEHITDYHALYRCRTIIHKIFNLEAQLVLKSYEETVNELRQEINKNKEHIKSEISESVYTVAENSVHVSSSSEQLLAQSEEISQIAMKGSEIAEQSEALSVKGKDNLDKQLSQMERVLTKIITTQQDTNELLEVSKNIEEIISVVNNIAEQTNLLSLNASIEAARAGQSGKGFAVVADEVKKLAEETQTSLKRVQDSITLTKNRMNDVTRSVKDVHDFIESSTTDMKEITESFNEILHSLHVTKKQNKNLEEELKQMVLVISTITENAENLSNSADTLHKKVEQL